MSLVIDNNYLSLIVSNGTDGSGSGNGSMWPLVAGVFAFLALFVSIWEITQHLSHYNKPYLQKYVIRILWMVPIYAMNSWLAMNFPKIAIYVDTLRECYEAFVIYSFMKYLLNFLFHEMDLELMIECKPGVKHLFPLCFLPPCVGGRRFLEQCKHGILQYVVIRPITTFLALFFEILDVYGEGHYGPQYAYPYLLVINNISQMIAMYCLVIFYTTYKSELAPMRPLAKFLCIKAVVFFSFFQGVVISIFIQIGFITQAFIPDGINPKHAEISRNFQDFLICLEMLFAAIAHIYAFSHKPFVDLAAVNDPICFNLMRILDLTDDRTDVTDHFRQIRRRIRGVFYRRREVETLQEDSPLIPLQPRNSKNYRSNQLEQTFENV
ncbi:transmembrane protein 184C-like [Oppia nitens]|uniref:transmembrane protein 184C-like n=1 Tax=Oppia nitens TaxID=1686743 RepID=UPI0023DC11B4|nr:transmembrane protein 184C-like [Oppia nitens]